MIQRSLKIVSSFTLLFFSISICIGQSSERKKINIDEGWKFHFGNASDPSKDFNYSIAAIFSKSGNGARTPIDNSFSDNTWRTVDLPHD